MHWMKVSLDLALIVSQLCLSVIHDARLWLNITKPCSLWASHQFSPSFNEVKTHRALDEHKAFGGFYQVQLNQEVSSVGVSHTYKTKRFLSCENIRQFSVAWPLEKFLN